MTLIQATKAKVTLLNETKKTTNRCGGRGDRANNRGDRGKQQCSESHYQQEGGHDGGQGRG